MARGSALIGPLIREFLQPLHERGEFAECDASHRVAHLLFLQNDLPNLSPQGPLAQRL